MKSSHTHTHTHTHTRARAILRPGGSCPRTQCGYYHQQSQCPGKMLAVPRHGPFLLFTANLCKWGNQRMPGGAACSTSIRAAATSDCNPRSSFQTGPQGQKRAKLDQGHSWAHLVNGGLWPASYNKSPSDRPEKLSSRADRTDPSDRGSSPGGARRHGGIRHARKSHAQVPNSGRRDESWD